MKLLTLFFCSICFVVNLHAAEVRIVATGDIMAHMGNIKAAQKVDGYDFAKFFSQEVIDLLSSGDLVIGNLETRFAGAKRGYTGYPAFNAPDELARDLKKIGFNFLTTANNHTLDRGVSGIVQTNHVLSEYGFAHTGSYSNLSESSSITVKSINGIKIAVLAYTYGTNGIKLPKGSEFMVNYLDKDKLFRDIELAKLMSDFIVVCVHWGEEYAFKQNSHQTQLAQKMFKAGVGLIIGHHPHVVQGFNNTLIRTDNGHVKKSVAYSLGNFISGQTMAHTNEGAILSVSISKPDGAKQASIIKSEVIQTRVTRPIVGGKKSYLVEIVNK
jgi:poly-gamma-glutamate capsule biosynthesis protein CapA/YwtB (metallophosphatase superfamily)